MKSIWVFSKLVVLQEPLTDKKRPMNSTAYLFLRIQDNMII